MEEIMLFITIFTVRDSNGHGSNFENVVWKEKKIINVDRKYFFESDRKLFGVVVGAEEVEN